MNRWYGVVAVAAAIALGSTGVASASSSGLAHTSHTGATTPRPASILNSLPPIGMNSVSYTGNGFDACAAPTEAEMAAWRQNSPYDAIGISIGGQNRTCSQPNLTPTWVRDEAASGWHFFLLYAGPQAPGSVCKTCTTMADPHTSSVGSSQVDAAASDAMHQAATLGFQPGTPILYDLQDYAGGGTDSKTVVDFLSDWFSVLFKEGYVGGVHGGMASAVNDVVTYAQGVPYYLDFASGNGLQSTNEAAIPATAWSNHQRINEYAFAHSETWGGITLNVDSDYLDVLSQWGWVQGQNFRPYAIGAGNSVLAWLGDGEWFNLGGQASETLIRGAQLYVVLPNGQGLSSYDSDTARWTTIGGPGAQFTIAGDAIYGLTPNHSAVYQWDDYEQKWVAVGGPASAIYGGPLGLIATDPPNSSAYLLVPKGSDSTWERIGGGGAQFVQSTRVTTTVYGLTADRSAVYQWSGTGTEWTKVGGPAQALFNGEINGSQPIYATSPHNAGVFAYSGTPNQWERVGGPGVQFAACSSMFLGLGSVGGTLYSYVGSGTVWQGMGGAPIESISCTDGH